jgi:hypothetical protein
VRALFEELRGEVAVEGAVTPGFLDLGWPQCQYRKILRQGRKPDVRRSAFLPLVFVGLVVAASDCGGAVFEAGSLDASADAASGDDGAGTSSGGSGSASSGGGHGSSSGSASSGSSGASSGSSASGSSSSGTSSSGTSASGGSGSGSGSSGGSSSTSSGSSSGAKDSGSGCSPACATGRACCSDQCVNLANDPMNCGGCGIKCGAGTYCNGSCQPIPCSSGGSVCVNGQTCCGTTCCTSGQLCCEPSGPVGGGPPACFTPTSTQSTCPQGCAPLCLSDRNLKRDIQPVDGDAVLDRVAEMPISTWSYKSDDPSVRHLGPMAQDFHAAFGLGKSDRTYDAIDAHGVELAAIKAIYERLRRDEAIIERLERDNYDLRQRTTCGP